LTKTRILTVENEDDTSPIQLARIYYDWRTAKNPSFIFIRRATAILHVSTCKFTSNIAVATKSLIGHYQLAWIEKGETKVLDTVHHHDIHVGATAMVLYKDYFGNYSTSLTSLAYTSNSAVKVLCWKQMAQDQKPNIKPKLQILDTVTDDTNFVTLSFTTHDYEKSIFDVTTVELASKGENKGLPDLHRPVALSKASFVQRQYFDTIEFNPDLEDAESTETILLFYRKLEGDLRGMEFLPEFLPDKESIRFWWSTPYCGYLVTLSSPNESTKNEDFHTCIYNYGERVVRTVARSNSPFLLSVTASSVLQVWSLRSSSNLKSEPSLLALQHVIGITKTVPLQTESNGQQTAFVTLSRVTEVTQPSTRTSVDDKKVAIKKNWSSKLTFWKKDSFKITMEDKQEQKEEVIGWNLSLLYTSPTIEILSELDSKIVMVRLCVCKI
jgi:hypothetical protein